jgi:hypothetical protein
MESLVGLTALSLFTLLILFAAHMSDKKRNKIIVDNLKSEIARQEELLNVNAGFLNQTQQKNTQAVKDLKERVDKLEVFTLNILRQKDLLFISKLKLIVELNNNNHKEEILKELREYLTAYGYIDLLDLALLITDDLNAQLSAIIQMLELKMGKFDKQKNENPVNHS